MLGYKNVFAKKSRDWDVPSAQRPSAEVTPEWFDNQVHMLPFAYAYNQENRCSCFPMTVHVHEKAAAMTINVD